MKNISDLDFTRFQKHLLLPEVGYEGQERLKNAKVLVVGAGGLGCPVLQYLGSNGVGTLGLVDFDQVEIHNLHRQVLYTPKDIGKLKVAVAKERLHSIYPEIELEALPLKVDPTNAKDLLTGYDLIVDGSDNFATRYLVNDTCVELGIPLIYGSILGFQGQVAVFNHQGGKNLRDVFPEAPKPEDVPNCDENGVLGTLPGIIGLWMAHETLKLILGLPVLRDQWVILDTLNWHIRKLSY